MVLAADAGGGGLDRLRIAHPTGSAELYRHGAHLTSWAPTHSGEVLWMSEHSRFSATAAIRGGVPVCFPWFGGHATDPSAPAHGFARLAEWDLVDERDTEDGITVTMRLTDTPETRASAWPHRFEALYTVSVGEQLSLALSVTNRDDAVFRFEEALHAYLAVADVREARVSGLEGVPYLDRLLAEQAQPGESAPVRIGAETDRIYLGPTAPTVLADPTAGRAITMTKTGSDVTVVWNPGPGKARAMTDFGDDEWPGMLCIEAGNARALAINLPPGETHTMSVRFEVTATTDRHP